MLRLSAPDKNRHLVYLGLGSNINPEKSLRQAIELLAQQVRVLSVSKAWKTSAVGSHGPDFLNAAVLIETELPPETLKSYILQPIEAKLGRVRTRDKNSPRTIDIDILVVNGLVHDQEIWRRAHLAMPLSELNTTLAHPESGLAISEVARQLSKMHPIYPQLHVLIGTSNPHPDQSH